MKEKERVNECMRQNGRVRGEGQRHKRKNERQKEGGGGGGE